MTETKDLIPLENPEPGALFAPGGLETILVRIETEARALVPDIATVKGRAAVASLAAKVAKAKTYLDGIGKDFTADLKRQTSAVDAERKAMRDRLDALKAEVRKPLDEWEQAEEDRVSVIRRRIACFCRTWEGDQSASFYADTLAEFQAEAIDETYAEFQAEAQAAKEACLYRLTQARDAALHREAEAARIAAEADAVRAKAQQEREERIAREAAERATREAQQKAEQERVRLAQAQAQAIAEGEARRKAAEHAQAEAERRTREADQKAREAAARAERDIALAKAREAAAAQLERDRAAAEARAKADADAKRAADEAHRKRIHEEIADDLDAQSFCGAMEWSAYGVVKTIAAGRIRHLTINY
jgi:hypothetical protein